MVPGSVLLSPFNLGGLHLPNRVAMAPMTRARAGTERLANARMARYYADRAACGLIVTEATVISEQANGWNQSPGIYTDAMAEAWRPVVDAVRDAGGRIFLQLWHCGRASHSSFRADRSPPVAPSAIAIANGEGIHTPEGKQPHEVPRPLETDEVAGVVEDYRAAAERALAAGFDGVEIHAANGYLIDTFLQSCSNVREDTYGGDVAGRFEFLREVVEAVISTWDPRKVGVRLSPNGSFNGMGSPDFRETFLFAASELGAYDLGYLHVLDGLAFGFHGLGEPMTLAEFRSVYPGTLVGNCGYDAKLAEATLAAGHADLIAFGRPFISNPDLVERIANDWPLNPPADASTWYSHGDEGYNDYPKYRDTLA